MGLEGNILTNKPALQSSRDSYIYRVIHKFLQDFRPLRYDCPLAVKPASTPWRLVHKKTWRDSLPIDTLLSAVSVLVVAQPSSEVPEGLMNYPVYQRSKYQLRAVQEHVITDTLWAKTLVLLGFPEHHNGQ